MVFFPIEDESDLARLRMMLSPFMSNVQQSLQYDGDDEVEKERLKMEIFNTIDDEVDYELMERLDALMIQDRNEVLNWQHKHIFDQMNAK